MSSFTIRHLLCSLLILAFSICLNGCDSNKQTAQKTYKIAILHTGKRFAPFINNFKKKMVELGYTEGENTVFIDSEPSTPEQLANQLNYLKTQDIDLLYTITTPITSKAHEIFKGTGTPIIFGPVYSPIEAGLTTSLTNPDKNMTGIMIRGSVAKAFGFLIETMPSLKYISVPFPDTEKVARLSIEDLKKNASKTGIELMLHKIHTPADLDEYIKNIPQETQVIWIPHSPFIMDNFSSIMAAAKGRNIPVASANPNMSNGILVSYGPDLSSITNQVARLADKILQGVPVSELPIEHCEYSLAINLEVARQTGITIPENVLRQATIIKTIRPQSQTESQQQGVAHPNNE